MTPVTAALGELARLASGSEPIVSLYLDVRWKDEHQRERVRLFVEERIDQVLGHYAPDAPGREALARTFDRIAAFTGDLAAGQGPGPGHSGVALFANEALGLWRTLFLRHVFTPELCADGIPHLAQLARAARLLSPVLVAAPAQAGTELWLVEAGEVVREERVPVAVTHRDKEFSESGASAPFRRLEREAKNERHAEAGVHRGWRAAAEALERMAREHGGASGSSGASESVHLVLAGTAPQLASFERELPPQLREKVLARSPRPRAWSSNGGVRRDGVAAVATRALEAAARAAERDAVKGVVGEALRGGPGVLGPDDVVLALDEGRIQRLVVEDDFQQAGWRCDNCGALGADVEAALRCTYCGGDLRAVRDLAQALVARTLAGGGEVEVVPHARRLHGYGGVGAFLRQTGSGMAGAPPGAGRGPPSP